MNRQPQRFERRLLIFAILACGLLPLSATAQIKQQVDPETTQRYGTTVVTRFRVGVTIDAKRGAIKKIVAMVAVPLPCAEQEVEMVEEDFSTHIAEMKYRVLNGAASGGARQMLVSIPFLPSGEKAHALVTFDVRTRVVLPPEDTTIFHTPTKPDRALKKYLGKSPYIEAKHKKIRKKAKEILALLEKENKEPTDWERVEAIYNFVRDTVKYVEGDDKSALQTLRDGEGDCQNISALFVALCRSIKVPARIVWVHNHSYFEFCLEDDAGKYHWFPCESSGNWAFGEMPLARTILQKGDNFRVPERKGRLRYASDHMVGQSAGGGKPKVRYVREQL